MCKLGTTAMSVHVHGCLVYRGGGVGGFLTSIDAGAASGWCASRTQRIRRKSRQGQEGSTFTVGGGWWWWTVGGEWALSRFRWYGLIVVGGDAGMLSKECCTKTVP